MLSMNTSEEINLQASDSGNSDRRPLARRDSDAEPMIQDAPPKRMHFWRRINRIRGIVWPNWYSRETFIFLVQVALALLYAWSFNFMSNHVGDVVLAICSKNREDFWSVSIGILAAAVLGSFANSGILSLGDYLCQSLFRRRLTAHIVGRYLSDNTYYKIMMVDRRITDPDSRIALDTETFCEKVKLILFGTPMYVGYLATTATCLWFFVTLWEESGAFVPCACIVMFIFSSLGSKILTYIPSSVSRELNDIRSQFQYLHTYFAMHTEHIAFLRGEDREAEKMTEILRRLHRHVKRLAIHLLPLNLWTMLMSWGNQFFAYFVPGLAWVMFSSNAFVERDKMINVGSVAYSLMSTLTTYVLLAQVWSELAAVTSRIGELLELIDDLSDAGNNESLVRFEESVTGEMVVNNLTFCWPKSTNPMVKNVSFTVTRTNSVVIMGPSGVGKTALLRVLAGLWPGREGSVSRPVKIGRDGLLFVPKTPYLTIGPLISQIHYPEESPLLDDDELESSNGTLDLATLESLLKEVSLEYLLTQFDPNETRNWCEVLSVGEQQRLGIARVLYLRPRIAIMDESTSAIDEKNEEEALLALRRRGIALLSVAHRSTVRKHHESILTIAPGGVCTYGVNSECSFAATQVPPPTAPVTSMAAESEELP